MWVNIMWFSLGLLAGTCLGIVIMGLMMAIKRRDNDGSGYDR